MIVRPVDENGDMMPIQNESQMIGGAEAVAQVAKDRLAFFYGEWWEDPEMGIRIPDFLANTVREGDVSMFAKYITSYLGDTAGSRGIAGATVEYSRREMIYRATILADDGSAGLEVDLSELL